MNIDTVTLQCFLALAETKSFTKAAAKVGRTQSAVSQQIARLENLLDCSLFDRSNKLLLTNEGEIFQEYARKILVLHLELFERFRGSDLSGAVHFGLPEDFAAVFLADFLADFARLHPQVQLNVECDLTLNLLERFKKAEFDLVLVKTTRPEDFPHGVNIWSENLAWVGRAEFLSQLLDAPQFLPLVLAPQPCVYRTQALKALEQAAIKWQIIFSSPSFNSTIAAVKAGLGLTVLPKNMIPAELVALDSPLLPKLPDAHISLLKQEANNLAVNFFEDFVLRMLKI